MLTLTLAILYTILPTARISRKRLFAQPLARNFFSGLGPGSFAGKVFRLSHSTNEVYSPYIFAISLNWVRTLCEIFGVFSFSYIVQVLVKNLKVCHFFHNYLILRTDGRVAAAQNWRKISVGWRNPVHVCIPRPCEKATTNRDAQRRSRVASSGG